MTSHRDSPVRAAGRQEGAALGPPRPPRGRARLGLRLPLAPGADELGKRRSASRGAITQSAVRAEINKYLERPRYIQRPKSLSYVADVRWHKSLANNLRDGDTVSQWLAAPSNSGSKHFSSSRLKSPEGLPHYGALGKTLEVQRAHASLWSQGLRSDLPSACRLVQEGWVQ
jgi:hypothetical protein